MTEPRILTLDIETSPHEGYFWRMFDENIQLAFLKRPSRIISVGRHWLGDPVSEVRYDDVWPHTNERMRRRMLRRVYADLSKADAVITFNGAKFDLPKLTGEFLMAGMDPLPPLTSIDVYRTTRRMGFASNKLEFVAPLLGCGRKMPSSSELWRDYVEGDDRARDKMRRYNIRDVVVLERVFNRVRSYIRPFPRLYDPPACPDCGGTHAEKRGYRKMEVFKVERWHCLSKGCGRWYEGSRSKI